MNKPVDIIIIENDKALASNLRTWTGRLIPQARVRNIGGSITDAVRFFNSENSADLILLDTDLSDGKGFEVLDRTRSDLPIIFLGDSENDVLKAFKYNTVHFLLKPVNSAVLQIAFEKFHRTGRSGGLLHDDTQFRFVEGKPSCRRRFLIKTGNKIQVRSVQDVALFFADGKTVYLVARSGSRKFMIDHTLEDLTSSLDPDQFFRINRKYIVCVDCSSEVRKLSAGKLGIRLHQSWDEDLIVSRERMTDFKRWLNR